MEKVKFLILGAGPTGLTFANRLNQKGENSFIVVEQEAEAGGLCRSVTVDGAPFDIGGGHFLDVRRPNVNDFLFQFMSKSEWKLFDRKSVININGKIIDHPLEANIWEFDIEEQVAYLESIAKAGCNSGIPAPERFVDWITWKFGYNISNDYMLPYNRKMFAEELNELGTYWLEKLPNVSFAESIRSCLEHKAYGTQPGHAQFYYPNMYGYGEVWLRMANAIKKHMRYHAKAIELDCNEKSIRLESGGKIAANIIIQTVPWRSFQKIIGMPDALLDSIMRLKHSSVETRYVPQNLDTTAQWIYIPDETVPYHRILVRHNFCGGSNGYWLETRQERTGKYDLDDPNYHYLNEYAYPLNTVEKPQIIKELLEFGRKKGIYGLGRWGEHSHYNSDCVVERAMRLVEELS